MSNEFKEKFDFTPMVGILLIAMGTLLITMGILLIIKVSEFITGHSIAHPWGLLVPFMVLAGCGYLFKFSDWVCDKI